MDGNTAASQRRRGRRTSWRASQAPTTFTSRRFEKTASRTARRPGSGPLSSTTDWTCEATTGSSRVGIKRRFHQKAGRIGAAGITKDVVFEPVNGAYQRSDDEAYRTKYA